MSRKDSAMNSKTVIVVVMQLMLACAPLNSQAAALDRDMDPEELRNINLELTQDYLNHRDMFRVKNNRQALLRERGRIFTKSQQSDLIRELLTPGDIHHGSKQIIEEVVKSQRTNYINKAQDTWLLEELLVKTSIP